MAHLPKLIEDLALILFTGAIVTLLFRRIKQPVVLGYIVAGFLVGPYISITPSVVDHDNIETLAEIGVIFLLFSLGLEFSFRKLVRVGGTATITALVEIVFITVSGYFVGRWLGWSVMDSVFLGGMLASSSTTIIIRAFDELGVKTLQFAGIVFGVLIVEDIVVILLMVLLSTMSVSQQVEGAELLFTISKLLFFLLFWFLAGIFLLPTFLKRAKKLLDEESMLVLAVGMCLGMVVLATQVGFSAELGAFIMGSILAETTSAERVEKLIKPVKNLFGAVFFVSIGMLIDPKAIIDNGLAVASVTMLVLFGKFFSTTFGALLSGQPLKQSIQVGMSMAQIGEFAFIVATLGLSLGVVSDFLFPVAVGASAITTFTTPYMIRLAEPFYNFLKDILPSGLVRSISKYSASTQKIQGEGNWRLILRMLSIIVLSNGIILLAIYLLSKNFLIPLAASYIKNELLAQLIALVFTLVVASPFLWALMTKKPGSFAYKELWLNSRYNRGPLVVIEVFRNLIGILVIILFVDKLISAKVAVLVAVPVAVLVLYLFSKKLQSFYQKVEGRFMTNYNERENAVNEQDPVGAGLLLKNATLQTELQPWAAYIADMEVGQHASYIGKQLQELKWREQFGINIAYIKRGDRIIHSPPGTESLLPFDHVGIISTEEQMKSFKTIFDSAVPVSSSQPKLEDIVLQKVVVDEYNKLKGLSIRESGIRESTSGLIIGIERDNTRYLNPESSTIFEWGDIVWLVGERKKIQKLLKVQS